ncbi:MAG: HDOD domain-containing protein [Pseudomonadota bacterium]
MSPAINLREAVGRLDTLPAMPQIAQKILALDLDSEKGEQELVRLIEQDPQISARLIGMANTSAFSSNRKVASAVDAIMLIGLTRTRSVALSIALMSSLVGQHKGKLDKQRLWTHGFGIVAIMRVIAGHMHRSARPSDEELHLAGMLHDIGYMVLEHIAPELSDALHTQLEAHPERPVTEVEAEVIDIGHAELGAELARQWNLPEEIEAVLRYHHRPYDQAAEAAWPLANLVHLSEKLMPSYGMTEFVVPEIAPSEWEAIGIEPDEAETLVLQVNEVIGALG